MLGLAYVRQSQSGFMVLSIVWALKVVCCRVLIRIIGGWGIDLWAMLLKRGRHAGRLQCIVWTSEESAKHVRCATCRRKCRFEL